jgi:hypothetical protein
MMVQFVAQGNFAIALAATKFNDTKIVKNDTK